MPIESTQTHRIAWQGWQFVVPDTWNPVKVDGDYQQGVLLLADMHNAKLGIRWRSVKRGDPQKLAKSAMVAEVGELAYKEASDFETSDPSAWKISKLYCEPDPPGRDIWFGWSNISQRVLEVVHHVKDRNRLLADTIMPSVTDIPLTVDQPWAIFDLSCKSPPGWILQWFQLNAGDLTLSFRQKNRSVRVRQVGPASLALSRTKLDNWIGQLDKAHRRIYRPIQQLEDATIELPGRTLTGRSGKLIRKRRLFWAFSFAKELATIGFHDVDRNRLIMSMGDVLPVMRSMIQSMGWAKSIRPAMVSTV